MWPLLWDKDLSLPWPRHFLWNSTVNRCLKQCSVSSLRNPGRINHYFLQLERSWSRSLRRRGSGGRYHFTVEGDFFFSLTFCISGTGWDLQVNRSIPPWIHLSDSVFPDLMLSTGDNTTHQQIETPIYMFMWLLLYIHVYVTSIVERCLVDRK